MLVGGIAVLAAYAFERDDDGYISTDKHRLDSATHAITSQDIDLGEEAVKSGSRRGSRRCPDSGRSRATGLRWHRTDAAVDHYLADVAYDELVDFHGDDPEFELHEGGKPRTAPETQNFWVAQSEGTASRS